MGGYRPLAALGIVMGMLCLGCAATRPTEASGRLEPATAPNVAEIPLPKGFILSDQSSEDWAAGSLRYVRHSYQGQADAAAVRRFYRKHMPLLRWEPIAENLVRGRCLMTFQRRQEHCTVVIERVASLLGGHVDIDVVIAPRQPE